MEDSRGVSHFSSADWWLGCIAALLAACEATIVGPALPAGSAGASGTTGQSGSGSGGNQPVNFSRSIRPILAKHCFSCHGADANTRYASLRLDDGVDLFAVRPDGRPPVVVRGDPAASSLYQRIDADDLELRMPPADWGPALEQNEIQLLENWILQGAPYEVHWSFVPAVRSNPPSVSETSWVRNPIDAFVLAELEKAGLGPNPEASPRTLIRRVTFDLTGLPPSPSEVEAFVADTSPDAYDRVVDRLLSSSAFGEHRARYWLDNVRYADTSGYHSDNYRSLWPYRDYVIRAFNDNMPFDRFTIEQIAGDLLPEPTLEQQVATGFIRASLSSGEAGLVEDEYAAIYAKDRVDTMSLVWLGLTTGCAACHDHKFDPLTQKDYYGLSAFFRNTSEAIWDGSAADAPPTVLVPPDMTPTLVAEEKPGEAFAHVLNRGRYDQPGERLLASVPAFLPALPAAAPANRLGLAEWLVASEHPLTARVVVNRFWSQLFGIGLVRSAHDFGAAGELPSHPGLLDWLAVEFRESGWNVKALFRLLVTSAVYRQSTVSSAAAREVDPDNRLLSRSSRLRLDAEMIRDQALAASGLLVSRIGGPSVKPYQPAGIWEELGVDWSDTLTYVPDSGESLYRRSVYTFWKRQAPPPSMEIFDAPTREQAVAQRERTNTPLQALVGLNDPQLVEAARHLAEAALVATTETDARLEHVAVRVLGRPFSTTEVALLTQTLADLLAVYRGTPTLATELTHVGDSPPNTNLDESELAAWTMIASTVLNLDEALVK